MEKVQPTSKPEYVLFTVKYQLKGSPKVYDLKSWEMWTGRFVTFLGLDGEQEPHTVKTVEAHMRRFFGGSEYSKFRFGLFGCQTMMRNDSAWEFIKLIKMKVKRRERREGFEINVDMPGV